MTASSHHIKSISKITSVTSDPICSVGSHNEIILNSNHNPKKKKFTLDYTATENQSSTDFFDIIGIPYANKFLENGCNTTIVSYGYKGTSTIFDTKTLSDETKEADGHQGFLSHLINYIWKCKEQTDYSSYSFSCSLYELYEENIIDLLDNTVLTLNDHGNMSTKENRELKSLQLHNDESGQYIDGLTEYSWNTLDDALRVIEIGWKNRHMMQSDGSSLPNSHVIFQFRFSYDYEESPGVIQQYYSGQFLLADVVWNTQNNKSTSIDSLSHIEKDTNKQERSIDVSLLALFEVIKALSDRGDAIHPNEVDFSKNKLTLLLKNAFSGYCETMLIANISTDLYDMSETLFSLRMAETARGIPSISSVSFLLSEMNNEKSIGVDNTIINKPMNETIVDVKDNNKDVAMSVNDYMNISFESQSTDIDQETRLPYDIFEKFQIKEDINSGSESSLTVSADHVDNNSPIRLEKGNFDDYFSASYFNDTDIRGTSDDIDLLNDLPKEKSILHVVSVEELEEKINSLQDRNDTMELVLSSSKKEIQVLRLALLEQQKINEDLTNKNNKMQSDMEILKQNVKKEEEEYLSKISILEVNNRDLNMQSTVLHALAFEDDDSDDLDDVGTQRQTIKMMSAITKLTAKNAEQWKQINDVNKEMTLLLNQSETALKRLLKVESSREKLVIEVLDLLLSNDKLAERMQEIAREKRALAERVMTLEDELNNARDQLEQMQQQCRDTNYAHSNTETYLSVDCVDQSSETSIRTNAALLAGALCSGRETENDYSSLLELFEWARMEFNSYPLIQNAQIEIPSNALWTENVISFESSSIMTSIQLDGQSTIINCIFLLLTHCQASSNVCIQCILGLTVLYQNMSTLDEKELESIGFKPSQETCEIVLDMLSVHAVVTDVVRYCIVLLAWILTEDNTYAYEPIADRILQSVNGFSVEHVADEDIVSSSCRIIAILASNNTTCNVIINNIENTLDMLISIISMHTSKSAIATIDDCLCAIRYVAIQWNQLDRMLSIRSCGAIVSSAVTNINSRSIADSFCRIVHSLTENNENNRMAFGAVGTCAAVVVAMQSHNNDVDIVYEAICSVNNLCLHPGNSRQLAAAGVGEVLTEVMRTNAVDASTIQQCCGVLVNILEHDYSCESLFGRESCAVLLAVVNMHAGIEAVALAAASLIEHIAANHEYNRLLGQIGACTVIFSILKTHQENDTVIEQAARCITSLAADESNNKELSSTGVCSLLVQIMKYLSGAVSVVESCCAAIRALARCPANMLQLDSAGAHNTLLWVMTHHASSPTVCCEGCHAMYILITGNSDIRKQLLSEGGADVVRAAADVVMKIQENNTKDEKDVPVNELLYCLSESYEHLIPCTEERDNENAVTTHSIDSNVDDLLNIASEVSSKLPLITTGSEEIIISQDTETDPVKEECKAEEMFCNNVSSVSTAYMDFLHTVIQLTSTLKSLISTDFHTDSSFVSYLNMVGPEAWRGENELSWKYTLVRWDEMILRNEKRVDRNGAILEIPPDPSKTELDKLNWLKKHIESIQSGKKHDGRPRRARRNENTVSSSAFVPKIVVDINTFDSTS